ncbi:flagellar hook-length control protein FliK [Thermotoga sp. KOL6]|uniref:flagellar hook-length control protein FliK n=1 Tax=Thermotoga sp. KOL6 TaxID=126741 RepID=UPI000C7756BF|nr:flagellar hook-length control protein FliK [Thermotoga sp. KOL6]PLV59373.1 hypothetical protein AS005_06440 [Thermotoga sp. KOL6]
MKTLFSVLMKAKEGKNIFCKTCGKAKNDGAFGVILKNIKFESSREKNFQILTKLLEVVSEKNLENEKKARSIESENKTFKPRKVVNIDEASEGLVHGFGETGLLIMKKIDQEDLSSKREIEKTTGKEKVQKKIGSDLQQRETHVVSDLGGNVEKYFKDEKSQNLSKLHDGNQRIHRLEKGQKNQGNLGIEKTKPADQPKRVTKEENKKAPFEVKIKNHLIHEESTPKDHTVYEKNNKNNKNDIFHPLNINLVTKKENLENVSVKKGKLSGKEVLPPSNHKNGPIKWENLQRLMNVRSGTTSMEDGKSLKRISQYSKASNSHWGVKQDRSSVTFSENTFVKKEEFAKEESMNKETRLFEKKIEQISHGKSKELESTKGLHTSSSFERSKEYLQIQESKYDSAKENHTGLRTKDTGNEKVQTNYKHYGKFDESTHRFAEKRGTFKFEEKGKLISFREVVDKGISELINQERAKRTYFVVEEKKTDVQSIPRIVEKMYVQKQEKAIVDLEPPKLGKLEVTITKENNNLKIVLKVHTDEAKHILEQDLPKLIDRFNERGFQTQVYIEKEENDDYLHRESNGQDRREEQREQKSKHEKHESSFEDLIEGVKT